MKKYAIGWLVVALVFSSLCVAQTEDKEMRWFSIDSLNVGLDAPPEAVKRQTPRESVRSFFDLTKQEEFEAAAHLLNLSKLSAAEQREKGSELARQLAAVLRRGEWIDTSNLSGRQDAAIVDPSGKNPLAGQPRRNLQLASLRAEGQSYDIRLARYRVGEENPVWLITPDSLSSVPLLYEEYGPSWLEEHVPQRFKSTFGSLQIWEWIAIPVFLLGVGSVGWFVHRLVGLVARWLPSGSPSIFAGEIRLPMALVVMTLVAQALLNYVVSFSAVATTSFRILLITILAWGIGMIALRFVDVILLNIKRRLVGEIDDTKPRDERKLLTSLYAVRRGIILVTVVAVTIYILSQIALFETLGMTLLASASILTVLLGIAGQAVLGNILSSFQVSLAKPIRMGDLVVFEDQWCYVEGIFYTFIRLRTWDERRLVVPVQYFTSKPFQNLSVKSAKMYRMIELSLHLNADIECLRDKFKEFAEAEKNVIEHHKLSCFVTAQTEAAQKVSFYLMTSEPFAGWEAEMNVREKLLAFIRDNHPEWWPREVVVASHHDMALGKRPTASPATVADGPDAGDST
ncbi:mechanosensitive ion channel family protein [Marinobacter panjinensis]|uniref:Mechanosensitive ion channel family protein n=1 Tax=Marinobacter panjinensis TaxID=2576384 RepID=A0A4U6R3E6_9GAMM|nr:mechanosensitive ion channel family protein [Marinobacter panjinensis]MCR8913346.1 mechanosensitive ion channel family protein [Marinobacter panjinensis]TKV67983.1 mechanosensitive ion channel family protein [Marinobacter panjinensis]